ncbi:MAG: hypothetical protein R3C19_19280 [Planctomycetaceae bacterium]
MRDRFKRAVEFSDRLLHLTSPAYRSEILATVQRQQLAWHRAQALIMVPSSFVVLTAVMRLARWISTRYEYGPGPYLFLTIALVVLIGFPLLIFVENFVPDDQTYRQVPHPLILAAMQLVKIPVFMKSDFLFPAILFASWLVSVFI